MEIYFYTKEGRTEKTTQFSKSFIKVRHFILTNICMMFYKFFKLKHLHISYEFKLKEKKNTKMYE